MPNPETILITVSGRDRPGLTSALMRALADAGATLGDVEQIVARGQLILGVVATVDDAAQVASALEPIAVDGVRVSIDSVDPHPTERQLGMVVTMVGGTITAEEFGDAARIIAAAGCNIDRIVRIARYPVLAFELLVSQGDAPALKSALVSWAGAAEIDIAIQPEGLGRRSQRLVVLDVDSTLIRDEVIELLAEEAGCVQEVREVTARAMEGELDFATSLRERVALLAGLDEAAMVRARDRVRLTAGARTFVRTLRRLGFKVALVSGGFSFFTDHLKAELGVGHAHANTLEVVDGRLTGRVTGPIVDRARKATLLRMIAEAEGISLDQTVAVGDGANDLDMINAAGLGIAFNAKPVVRDAADTAINVPYLDAILFVLGVRRTEVEAADVAEGYDPFPAADAPPAR